MRNTIYKSLIVTVTILLALGLMYFLVLFINDVIKEYFQKNEELYSEYQKVSNEDKATLVRTLDAPDGKKDSKSSNPFKNVRDRFKAEPEEEDVEDQGTENDTKDEKNTLEANGIFVDQQPQETNNADEKKLELPQEEAVSVPTTNTASEEIEELLNSVEGENINPPIEEEEFGKISPVTTTPNPLPKDDFFDNLDPKDSDELKDNKPKAILDNSLEPDIMGNDSLTEAIKKTNDGESLEIDMNEIQSDEINLDTQNLVDKETQEAILNAIDILDREEAQKQSKQDPILDKLGSQLVLPGNLITQISRHSAATNKKPGFITVPYNNPQAPSVPIMDLTDKNFECHFQHNINTVQKFEAYTLTLIPKTSMQQPIKMKITKELEVYKYLNTNLEDVNGYPAEFSVLRHFCKSMTVQKSVVEGY